MKAFIKRGARALPCLLVVALFAASAAAQSAAPAAPAAPPAVPVTPQAAPAVPPAAPVAPATAPEIVPLAAEPDAAVKRVYEILPPCMVTVKIKVLEEREALYEERSPIEAMFDEYVRERLPVLVSGVRVSAEGLVLIRDPNLPLKRYAEITATDAAGVVTPMRVAGVLEHYAAVLLEPVKPPEQKLPCLTFAKADLKTGDSFLLAEPSFIEDAMVFDVDQSFASSVAVEAEEKHLQLAWWQEPTYNEEAANIAPSTAPIVFDDLGRPIGIALDNSLWTSNDGADSWIGARIMADGRLTPDALAEVSKKILAAARTGVKEIEITFRSDSHVGDVIRLEEGRLMAYGLLLDKDGTIFVPTELDRFTVRKIDKITLIEGNQRIETQFLGLFRDFGGFLIKAKKPVAGEPAALVDAGPLPRGKIFYSLSVRRRYGRRADEVEYNRYLDIAKSYKESRYPVPRKPLRVGDFLADADGRLLGFCAPFRREDRDEILARQRNSQNQSRHARPYLFTEVAALLRAPQGHFDPLARPMSRKEELRPAWLGVEFQPMTPSLARALDAESATRGGARGLLVTDVYDASPATRNGIKPGDILLSISLRGFAGEIDLAVGGSEGRRSDVQGRLWRPTANYLTALLTQIGPGREARLRLLQGKEEKTLDLILEKAPDDFDNADQFQETSIGLTVRELTYEVRKVLRLPADAPGVVVSQVESGSKAAVAQIAPYEIISSVNGQPATTLGEFERLVRSAQATGKIEFMVADLGVTRIVELDIPVAVQ